MSQHRSFGAWSIVNPARKSLRRSGVAVAPRWCKPLQLQSSLMQYYPICDTLRHFSGLLERVFTLHKASASGDGAIMGPNCGDLANRSTQSKTRQRLKKNKTTDTHSSTTGSGGELATGYARPAEGPPSDSLCMADLSL